MAPWFMVYGLSSSSWFMVHGLYVFKSQGLTVVIDRALQTRETLAGIYTFCTQVLGEITRAWD